MRSPDYNKNWKKRWADVVKNDQDYDEINLVKIIVNKLKLMREYFAGYDCNIGDTKDAVESLTYAISLGERLIDNKFNDKAHEAFEKHAKYVHKDGIVRIVLDSKEGEEECNREYKLAIEERTKIEHEFWDTIKNNWRSWWD